jgi:membrane-bound lytic murein transglycosylase D
MKGRLLLLTGLIFAAISIKAQPFGIDSIDSPSEEIISGFEDNLDSLLNLWYVEQAVQFNQADSILLAAEDTGFISFPDSVYIDRLLRIPTVINLSYNRIVRNYIELYANKRRERVRIMLTLSDYYFPMFEEVFDEFHIPQELKYLSIIESALNPRAVSRAGATGMWQFMYSTGKHYNLQVNSLVDERQDPYKSTYAAAAFLSDLYKIYNDWILAIAAYNCGPGNVNKAIKRSGGKRNYWDIYYYLPRETRGYVPAFIAALYIMNYPEEHNLAAVPVDFEMHTDTMLIRNKLHLKQVSEVLNIPLNQLRDLNPQYKADIVPGDSREYILRIPAVQAMRFIEYQDSIFAYKDSLFFSNVNMIVNPTARNYSAPVMPSDKYTRLIYEVKPNDNLGYISMWYDVRISDIRYWNNIRSNTIRAGQKLSIYVPNGQANKYASINKLSFAEKQKRIGKEVASASSNNKAEPIDENAEYIYYQVKSGDSLWEIAKKYPGVSDAEISKLNNLKYGETINPGQMLKIKKKI